MNTKRIVSSIVVGGGAIMLGLGLQYALAQTTWTPAPGTPPTCPSSVPGCNAPINVGGASQAKLGGLGLGTTTAPSGGILADIEGGLFAQSILTQGFTLASGACNGCILSSNTNGTASWVSTSTLGSAQHGIIVFSCFLINQVQGNVGCSASPSTNVTGNSNNNGIFTWTVPAGVNSIDVKAWGVPSNNQSGGYAESIISVTPGSSYAVKVAGANPGGNGQNLNTTSDFGSGTVIAQFGGFGPGTGQIVLGPNSAMNEDGVPPPQGTTELIAPMSGCGGPGSLCKGGGAVTQSLLGEITVTY